MKSDHYSFQRLFLAYLFGIAPVMLLMAMLSLIGLMPAHINNKPYYGFAGFIAITLFMPLLSLGLTIMNWVTLKVGDWIYDKLFHRTRDSEQSAELNKPSDSNHYSFKWLLIRFALCIGPIMLLSSIAPLFNNEPVYILYEAYHGFNGFLAYIVTMPVSIFVLTIMSWVFLNIGEFIRRRIFSRIRKKAQ